MAEGYPILAALHAAGKVVSAWILPDDNPTRDLTLNGSNVEGWAAAYGTHPVNLAELTNPTQWDPSAFGGRGAVTGNGTSQYLTGTGLTGWPGSTDDLYILVGVNVLSHGAAATTFLEYGLQLNSRGLGTVASGYPCMKMSPHTSFLTGASLAGKDTFGGIFDLGGTSIAYQNGVAGGSASTASATLALARVRMFAAVTNTVFGYSNSQMLAGVILNATASPQDLLDLEAEIHGKLVPPPKLKVYDGSDWQPATIQHWDGDSCEPAVLRLRDGTRWVTVA